MELIYIRAGKFIMGEKVGVALNNYPQHVVNFTEYWIYKTPVTNQQYKKCVKEGVCSPPDISIQGAGNFTITMPNFLITL